MAQDMEETGPKRGERQNLPGVVKDAHQGF